MSRTDAWIHTKQVVIAVALALFIALLNSRPSYANHNHDYAPCWANGYGDGDNNNGFIHPYIHYQGDASCGYNSLQANMRIAMHYHPGPAGQGGFDRVYYNHCGFGYHCHADLSAFKGSNECSYAAALVAHSPIADHWHHHHYTCAFI